MTQTASNNNASDTSSCDNSIAQRACGVLAETISIRHDLHAHPELMFEETRTSKVVQDELKKLGIEYKAGFAKGTGVIGYLPANAPGGESSGAVALRADMDALPITETTGAAYASTTAGIMHACGHDGHVAILLGAAKVLSQIDRPNPVLFVFQPAEEGGAGADHMVREGALDGKTHGGLGEPVARMFGLHGWPSIDVGTVSTRPGPLLAATDEIEITITGTQCHAAYPHLGADPIVAASHVVTALQQVVSRSVAPTDSCVVTIGSLHAGTAHNVIPASAHMLGTVRTLSDDTRARAKQRVIDVVNLTAQAHGCEANVQYHDGYPVTRNDAVLTEVFFDTAMRVIGEDNVMLEPTATMGGEDFSYYCEKVPACFFFLGIKPKNQATYPSLHQPEFDFNDDAIETGVRLMCELATRAL